MNIIDAVTFEIAEILNTMDDLTSGYGDNNAHVIAYTAERADNLCERALYLTADLGDLVCEIAETCIEISGGLYDFLTFE